MNALMLKVSSPKNHGTFTDSWSLLMKLILFLPAAGLLLSSSVGPQSHPGSLFAQSNIADPSPKIWVENEHVYLGETIHLRFSTPHPQFLGVVDPDGKFFYVVFPSAQSVGNLTPLVDSKTFVLLPKLEIPTSGLKADPYRHGVMDNQPVFTKSGAYSFILGDNLHTDDPSALYRVKVRYTNTARPGPQGQQPANAGAVRAK